MVIRFFGWLPVVTATVFALSATPDGLDYVTSHEHDTMRSKHSSALQQHSFEYLTKRYKQIAQLSLVAGIAAGFVTNKITNAYGIAPRLRFVASSLIGIFVAPYVWAHQINNLYSKELPSCVAEQLKSHNQ